jgi:hypothetical protein
MENSPVIAALAQIKLGMAPVKQRVASTIPSSGSPAGALLPLTTSYTDDLGEHGQEDRSELTGTGVTSDLGEHGQEDRSELTSTGVTSIEWDVWLDPKEPESLEKAVIEHGSLFATLFGGIPFMRSYFLKSAPSVINWVSIYGEAISRFNALSGQQTKEMPSICLDIKSAWSTADHIDRFISTLKQTLQINVRYVGSFSHRQIVNVTKSQTILFCHAVWDLQKKVASGFFSKKLMINGADLEEGSNLEILRGIVADPRLELEIGIYVQEPEAGTEAVQRLIQMVNSEPELFKLGFALGNSKDGRSSRMIKGSGAGIQKILLTNGLLPRMQRAITQIGLFAYSFFRGA